jgi:hypothetical protein
MTEPPHERIAELAYASLKLINRVPSLPAAQRQAILSAANDLRHRQLAQLVSFDELDQEELAEVGLTEDQLDAKLEVLTTVLQGEEAGKRPPRTSVIKGLLEALESIFESIEKAGGIGALALHGIKEAFALAKLAMTRRRRDR